MFNFFRPMGGSAPSSWKEDDQRRQDKPENKPKRSPQKSPSDIHALPAPNSLPAPSRQPPPQGEALKRPDPIADSPAPRSSKPTGVRAQESCVADRRSDRKPTGVRAQESRVADQRSDRIKTPADSPAPRSSKSTGVRAQEEDAPRRVITAANFGCEQPSKRPACRSPTALMEAIQSLIVEADMEELRASSHMIRSDAGRAAPSSRLPLPRLESESAGRNAQAVPSATTLAAKAAAPIGVASTATADAIARSRRPISSASVQQGTPEKPTSAAEPPGVEEDIRVLRALFANELTVAAIPTSTLSPSSPSSGSAHAFETGAAPADAAADAPSAASLVPVHADSAIVPVEPMPMPTLAGAAANEGAPTIASVPAPAPASTLECTRPQATNQSRSNPDDVVRADDTHAGASGSKRHAVSRTRGAADPTVAEGMQASGSSMQSTPFYAGQPLPNACATPPPAWEQAKKSIMAERGAQLPSAIPVESTSADEEDGQGSVGGGLPTPDRIRTASAEDSFAILKTEEINSDPLLVESALARLGSLCSARQAAKARSLPLLADGIGSIVRVLDAHGESESVQAAGCSLISRLASNEARKQEVVDAGAFGAIQAAFSRHTASVRVAKWGGLAVLKLTQDSSVRCQLAIAAGLGDALSSVVTELSHTRGALSKDCNAKALASIHLAQNWLQFHSDLVAGPNHFVVFRDTAGLPSKVARRYDDPRKSPPRLDWSPEAQMLAGTPAGALRPPFEWSVRGSPVFPSMNKGQEVEEPEPKGWVACLKPCLTSLREERAASRT